MICAPNFGISGQAVLRSHNCHSQTQSRHLKAIMGGSQYDTLYDDQRPWNAGRLVGAKKAFKQKQIWAMRFFLDHEHRVRDRVLLDLAIDSKLRGCDLMKLKIGSVVFRGGGLNCTQ